MNGYRFYRVFSSMVGLGMMPLAGVFFLGQFIYNELAMEAKFRRIYGANWRYEFEGANGPLSKLHTKMVISGLGIIAIGAVAVWLARLLQGNQHSKSQSRHRKRKPRSHHHGSSSQRLAVFRRNSVLGICFGLLGIVAGILLVVFRWGIFDDHADEIVLAMFVFLAGYLGTISGCSYWLKAKGWNEGIVFIAFMPLVIVFIPFVRLILLAAPAILPVGMVMMPLVLIVVVAALPDKTGMSNRRRGWRKGDWQRLENLQSVQGTGCAIPSPDNQTQTTDLP